MAKGIRVSTKDVSRVPREDLTFSSDQSSPKVATQGIVKLTTDASGNGIVQVFHGLKYVPIALTYYNPPKAKTNINPDFFPWLKWNDPTGWGFVENVYISTEINENSIIFRSNLGVINTTYTIKYFLFVEPAKNV